MYEVPHKDTMKYEILPHLSVAKRGMAQNTIGQKKFNAVSTS